MAVFCVIIGFIVGSILANLVVAENFTNTGMDDLLRSRDAAVTVKFRVI